VEILPSGQSGRIRGLQTHKKKEETAVPGSRTAVNISGVDTDLIQRGEVVVHPNQYQATRRIDARFRLLKDAASSLKHSSEVKLFVSASETIATLRLLGTEELLPGEEGWIQLELRDPVVAVRGDRYILRRPSPSETLGGGVVIDHQPKGRHKRFDEKVLKSLEFLTQGSPADVLFEAALALNAAPLKEMVTKSRLESSIAAEALKELISNGQLIILDNGAQSITSDTLAIALPHWNGLQEKIFQIIETYHKDMPLRRGIPREELKSKLKITPRIFNSAISLLVKQNFVFEAGKSVSRPGHEIKFNGADQLKVKELMRKFESNPYGAPSIKECQNEVGEEIVNALIELGELVTVSQDVIFRKKDYDEMVNKLRTEIQQKEQITLAEVRDLFNTSRKYAQALLEHLDSIGVTMRNGDFRKLRT
jgi:selenocysteine-specific elongation factor